MPCRLFCGLLILTSLPAVAAAQLPNPALDFVYPAGGQAGTKVIVQCGGRDLDEAQRLLFSHPGITGQVVMRPPGEFETAPQSVPGQFEVHIALNVPPGTYDARILGRFGVSTPRSFVVGEVPEQQESGDHHTAATATPLPLDVVVNGRTDGGAIDYYRFPAQQGQKVVVECVAKDIGSSLTPVITIWDTQQQQLARSKHLLDPIVEFVAPATGEYLLGIHDHVFGGGNDYAYRVRIHSGPYLVAISPSVAHAGTNTTFWVYGRNLPAGEADDDVHLDGEPLERQQVSLFVPPLGNAPPAIVDPVSATPDGFLFRWPASDGHSNGLLVAYAQQPVITEIEANDTPDTAQIITIPCDYSGRFYPRRDQDWVQFTAAKGQAYQVRIISHRLGHPTDPELFVQKVVRNADGKTDVSQVSTEDDFKSDGNRYRQALRRGLELSHRDPIVRFTADQDGDYRVGLRDLNGSSIDDPRFGYRLVIEPQTADFDLLAWTQQQAADDDKKIDRASMVLRRAGTLAVLVDVRRQGGFDGEVRVSTRQLPKGVTASECRIPAGQSEGVLILAAGDDAPAWCGPIEIVGHASVDGQRLVRVAREAVLTGNTGNVEQNRPNARLARQLCLAVVGQESEPAQVEVAAHDASSDSVSWQTSVGAKLAIPLMYVKHAELKSELGLQPIGLPDKVKAEGLTLAPDASDAELKLALDSNEIKPGTYVVFLRGKLKAVYARNPQAIATAQSRRSDFDSVRAQLDEEIKQAAAQVAQAQQVAAQKNEQLKQLETAQQAVGEALVAASQQVAQASQGTAGLEQSSASIEGERVAVIGKLVQDLRAATTEAASQVQVAQAAIQQLGQQLTEARTEMQAVQDEVTQAEARHKQATETKQRADEYVKQLDQQLADAQKNFGPAEVTSYINSPAIVLEVHSSPLTASVPAEPVKLQRGETREVPIEIQRRFGFAEAVQVSLQVPEAVKDIGAEPRTIERHKASATLQVTAGADASPGQHNVDIQLSMKFNGVDLQHRVPLQIVIQP